MALQYISFLPFRQRPSTPDANTMAVHPDIGMVPVSDSTLGHELIDSLQRRLCRVVEYKASASNVRVLMVVDDPNSLTALMSAQISVAGKTLWHYYYVSASPNSHIMRRVSGYEGHPQHLARVVPNICYDPDASMDPSPLCDCVPRPVLTDDKLYWNRERVIYSVGATLLRTNSACPFLDLPRELRDQIYRYALQDNEAALDLGPSRSSTVYLHSSAASCAAALSLVNRQVHREFGEEVERFCLGRPLLVVTTLNQKWKRKTPRKISHYVIRLAYPPLNLMAQLEDHVRALLDAGIESTHIILLLMPSFGEVVPRSTQNILESFQQSLQRRHMTREGELTFPTRNMTCSLIVRYPLEHYSLEDLGVDVKRSPSGFNRYATMTSLSGNALERDAFVTNRYCLRSNDIRGLFNLLRDYNAPSATQKLIATLGWKHTVMPSISSTEKAILERVIPLAKQSSSAACRLPDD